ncbi:MAG: DUF4880 domain-containing protein [Rhodospirillales bacterium]|nr:DUF4880 domain-containing protein [Rhodospirillales bacterium]
MAVSPTPRQADRDQIDDEAAEWLLLISEAPKDADLQVRLQAWCSRSDLHREVWERTLRTYRLIGETPALHRTHWQPHAVAAVPPATAVRRTSRRRLIAGGAALAAVAAGVVAMAPAMLLHLHAAHVTSTAELRVLTLDDGSRVHLGPESALDVAYSDSERRVRLLAGRAFFDVTPNTARPFRVVAGEVTTTVLGTAFEVSHEQDVTTVAVRHGHVRVDDKRLPSSRDLRDGETLRVAARGVVQAGTVPADDVGDWTRGQVVARNKSIADIVAMLRPYYDGLIVVQDDAFSRIEVSGIYDLLDPVGTLRSLASLHGATMRQISPWLLVVTSR